MIKKPRQSIASLCLIVALAFGASGHAQTDDPIQAAIIKDAIEADSATSTNAERPKKRPKTLGEIFGVKKKARSAAKFCKNKALVGETIAPISQGACGIKEPVRITEIAGVRLINGAIINCDTANATAEWIEKSAKKQLKRKGGGLEAVRVAASYACRTRNHRAGAKLSEHSFGNAIDFSEFHLKNGEKLTVLNNWSGKHSKAMRKMHKDACRSFGTVLGPKADRYHQDHFHFDVAKRRSGSYCR